jgi:hypothetical protein
MRFQEETYYKIEAYLSGELDAEEVTAFEKQISADDLLKAEVEKHKVANALIMEQRLLSVKGILQEERVKDSDSGNNRSKPFGFILLAVAAVGIGTTVWMLNKENVPASFVKEEPTKNQVVSPSAAPDKNNTSVKNVPVENHTLQPVDATTNKNFQKQQIQQAETGTPVNQKLTAHIDSAAFQKTDVRSVVTVVKPSEKITNSTDLCAGVSIQATIKASATCIQDATGSILVNNIQGGTKPYSVSLSSGDHGPAANGTLSKGSYQVLVRDAMGCVHTYPDIVITEKECPKDYSFNPFYGNEEWEIASQDSDRELEIYDKGGIVYFRKHIPASVSFNWNGMGSGNQVIPGYYIFVMKYANGTVQRGSVTIVQ